MTKYAFVTNTDSNTISVVNLNTTEEVKQIDIGESPRGAIAIDEKRGFGFVSNCAGNTISVIDLTIGLETSTIVVGLAPRGVDISPDNRYLFVANSGSASVSIVDLESQTVVLDIPTGRNPRQLQVSPDGCKLFVPNFGSDDLTIIDIDQNNIEKSKVDGTVYLGKDARPYHAYPNEDGSLVFTANTFGNSVSVVSVASKEVIRTVHVYANPRAVITEPSGQYLFVSTEATNTITVIRRDLWEVVKQIPVGATPRGLVVNPENNTLIVTAFVRHIGERNLISERVSVISLETLNRIGKLPSGLGACSVNIVDSNDIHDFFVVKSMRTA